MANAKKTAPAKKAITVAAPKPSAESKRWEAQDALRTLQRAEEIKRNASLLKAAQREAQLQVKALATIAGKK